MKFAWKCVAAASAFVSATAMAGLEEGLAAYKADDYQTALRELKPLADRGNPVAQQKLGWMYSTGSGVAQDMQKALALFRLSAAKGDAVSQVNLGAAYVEGDGVQKDFREAAKWFSLAAAKGDTDAMFNLGVIYRDGADNFPKDLNTSIKWLKSAAQKNNASAQRLLAELYATGESTPKNPAEALRLFRLAVANGNSDAKANLGSMYALGMGVPQSMVAAYALFIVSRSENPQAKPLDQAEMDNDLTGPEQAQAKTLSLEMMKGNTLKALDAFDAQQAAGMKALAQKQTTRYKFSADGQEVTDLETELTWRRCVEGMRFVNKNCEGAPTTFSQAEALSYAKAEATKSGKAWHLPDIMAELMTIRDTGFSPPFNPLVFPGTPNQYFWVSGESIADNKLSEALHFYDHRFDASHGAMPKTEKNVVRLVRID